MTANSMILFQLLELPVGCLVVDPDLRESRFDYKQAKDIIKSLQVVNDHAEYEVALIQKYSGLITHDEMQLQLHYKLLKIITKRTQIDGKNSVLDFAKAIKF